MRGIGSDADVNRRDVGATIARVSSCAGASFARGRITGTSRGARSCNMRSVACTIGWAWNRSRIRPSRSTLARATTVIPWWCAM